MPHKKTSHTFNGNLLNQVGHDAISDFESDPSFVESNPTASASSQNLGAGMAGEESNADETEESGEYSNVTAINDTQEVSQDETRLEGASQSARGRGSRKSARQAA